MEEVEENELAGEMVVGSASAAEVGRGVAEEGISAGEGGR